MPIKTRNSETSMRTAHLRRCEELRDGEIEIEEGLKQTIDSCIRRVGKDNQKPERCYALLMGLYALQTLIEDEGRKRLLMSAQISISINRGYPAKLNAPYQKILDDYAEDSITNSQALIILGYILSNETTKFRIKTDWWKLAPALLKILPKHKGEKKKDGDSKDQTPKDQTSTPNQKLFNRIRLRKKRLEDKARENKTEGALDRLHHTAKIYFQETYATFQL